MKTTMLNTGLLEELLEDLTTLDYDVKSNSYNVTVTDVDTGAVVLKGLVHSSGKHWLISYDEQLMHKENK